MWVLGGFINSLYQRTVATRASLRELALELFSPSFVIEDCTVTVVCSVLYCESVAGSAGDMWGRDGIGVWCGEGVAWVTLVTRAATLRVLLLRNYNSSNAEGGGWQARLG